jgi:hypothetical protein
MTRSSSARLLELFGRVLEPLVKACTHFTP